MAPKAPKKQSLKDILGARIQEIKLDGAPTPVVAEHMGDDFTQLLSIRAELSASIKELEEAKEDISMDIARQLVTHGYLGCTSDSYGNASIIGMSRHTVNKDRLLEHGVTAEIIEACTDVSESFSLRVSEAK